MSVACRLKYSVRSAYQVLTSASERMHVKSMACSSTYTIDLECQGANAPCITSEYKHGAGVGRSELSRSDRTNIAVETPKAVRTLHSIFYSTTAVPAGGSERRCRLFSHVS